MLIVNERYRRLSARIAPRTWDRIRQKCAWEGMTQSAVIREYPEFIPKRLRKLAASCFVATSRELYTERRKELRRELAAVERTLAALVPEKGTTTECRR